MKHVRRYLGILSVTLGLGMFLYLLSRSGVNQILGQLELLGWGIAGLILLSGARHATRAIAWQYCLDHEAHRPSFLRLFELRLVGEAFTDITPAGPLLGESVKVWASSNHMPLGSSAASVVIENLVYALACALFILGGMALLVFDIIVPGGFGMVVMGVAGLLLLSILALAFVLGRRDPLLGEIIDKLKSRGVRWSHLFKYEQIVRNFELRIHNFFRTKRKTFFVVLVLELAASLTGIAEVYLILLVTTGHTSLLTAYLVEAANRVAHLVFFVPLGFGTEEAAAGATLAALGYALSEGVSVAVIRKVRTAFWVAIGLALAAKWSLSRSRSQAIVEYTGEPHETLDYQCG